MRTTAIKLALCVAAIFCTHRVVSQLAAGDKGVPAPTITRKDLTKDELQYVTRHVPEPFRRGLSDEQLAKELAMVACAFDYAGGGIRFWLEVDEKGQETMSKRLPAGKDEVWEVKSPEGHVYVALRRGVSERIALLAAQVGKKADFASVGIFVYRDRKGVVGPPAVSIGHDNALWYGWKKSKVSVEQPDVRPKLGEETTVCVIRAEETTEGVKEPRTVKLTVKAVIGNSK